jgi:hypothetical protein
LNSALLVKVLNMLGIKAHVGVMVVYSLANEVCGYPHLGYPVHSNFILCSFKRVDAYPRNKLVSEMLCTSGWLS